MDEERDEEDMETYLGVVTTHLTWKNTLFRLILILVWTVTVFIMGMGWRRSPCEMKSYRDLITGHLVIVYVIEKEG